jgi:hypothetical protein
MGKHCPNVNLATIIVDWQLTPFFFGPREKAGLLFGGVFGRRGIMFLTGFASFQYFFFYRLLQTLFRTLIHEGDYTVTPVNSADYTD